jgi:membrane fusion protein (multidrug efflux system)
MACLLSACVLSGGGCEKKQAAKPGSFAVSVVAEPVKEEKIEEKVALVGTLAANESVEIKNEIAGVIERIGFEEGQPVKKDQVLFRIDAGKLKATLVQAQANFHLAQTTFDRLSSLIKANAISQQEFDQATSDLESKKAETDLIEARLKETVITAAFDGSVGGRDISVGQFVEQGTALTYLVSQDHIKAEFHLPERFLGQLKEGQDIEVMVAAYPEQKFKGVVYFIAPQVDEMSRSALVKAKIPNPDGKLCQGMFANLELIVAVRPEALVVPETALIPQGDDVFVFVVDKESKSQMKKVKVGPRLSSKAEILEGLSVGEKVIMEGYQKVGPGTPLNIKDPASGPSGPKDY